MTIIAAIVVAVAIIAAASSPWLPSCDRRCFD
jgi:hypothetical protein